MSTFQERAFLGGKIYALSNLTKEAKAKNQITIFLHGYLDNAASFLPLLSHLKHLPCIALDLPGHGKSAHRSADAHYHLSDYVYDLHQLITEQQFTEVNLVGHSLGGIISTIYAASFPENIAQVFSIESFGPLCESEQSSVQQLRDNMLSRDKAKSAIKHPSSMQSIVDARLRVSDLHRDNAALILERNIENKAGKLRWRTDKRLRTKSALRFTEAQAHNVLSNIECPYHLILADKGFEKIKRLQENRAQLVSDLRIYKLKGGHHVHMEDSASLAQIIIEGLSVN